MAYLWPTAWRNLAGNLWWLEMTWRPLYSQFWCVGQRVLRAKMANWSVTCMWSLAFSQHGHLRVIELVPQQFRGTGVHLPTKWQHQFPWPSLGHHTASLPLYSSGPRSHKTPAERKQMPDSKCMSKDLWPFKNIATTNPLTINNIYSATWKTYLLPLPRYPESQPIAAARQGPRSDYPTWVQVQMKFFDVGLPVRFLSF